MSGNSWYCWGIPPATIWAFLLAASSATAAENPKTNHQQPSPMVVKIPVQSINTASQIFTVHPNNFRTDTDQTKPSNSTLLADLNPSETSNQFGEIDASDEMEQITNVSQLTDVKPTDWAYGALRDLVERYGCIAGYPDSLFRGNRAVTRYEFAAGVKQCLSQIETLLQGSSAAASKQDLDQLQQLLREFQVEVATLRGRIDGVEARTAELEAQQFSATTKLNGLAWINITGAFPSSGQVQREGVPGAAIVDGTGLFANAFRVAAGTGAGPNKDTATSFATNPSTTMSALSWLLLNTSFTGKDSLYTLLAAGNGLSPANLFLSAGNFNNSGTPFLDHSAGPFNGSTQVIIRELSYTFPLSNQVKLTVGPRINQFRYFDDNRFTFFLNGASSFQSNSSSLSDNIKRGAGAVLQWQLSNQLKLNLGYLGESHEFSLSPSALAPTTGRGLFGGTNQAIVELDYAVNPNLNLRFYYGRNNLETSSLNANFNSNIKQLSGYSSIQGVVDAGSGCGVGVTTNCNVNNATADIFLFNFDWLLSKNFGLFGRYTLASHQITPTNTALPGGKLDVQSLQFGLAFPDLGKAGAMGTLSLVMPYNYTAGQKFLVAGAGDGATQYDLEANYVYPLTDNIDIAPAFYAIFNPNNFGSNPTVYVGTLRTQFKF